MALTYSRYFDTAAEAVAVAQAAKAQDGLKVVVIGPVRRIQRPKKPSGQESWPNAENKDIWLVVATDGEWLIV
jgi:hypothetical protein